MKLRHSMLALAMLATTAGWAQADSVTGTLYYTTFAGGQNVWKVNYNYDGGNNPVGSFTFGASTNIASLGGADGILFDPNTGNLLVGGQQSGTVYMVTPAGAPVSSFSAGTNVEAYHLSIDPTGNTLWVGTCCNNNGNANLGEMDLTPFSAGTGHDVTGNVSYVDTLAWVPTGNAADPYTVWYTSSDPNGGEFIGTINLNTYVTTNKASLPASHGMVWDPLSSTLILMGDDHITQWNPFTNTLVGDLDMGALACQFNAQFCGLTLQFDQGTIDGKGHIFAATNNGYLFFVDYSAAAGHDIDLYSFIGAQFLANSLDDIAPLVGAGAPVPEPMTLSLLGLGLAAAGRRAWKRRATNA